ncbi:MAG TPA: GNAT family N-acetyltransferase [Methylococcus sp.]|nr:GNAT family N-acetyltransferase [Methylococcus sp.]
MSLPPGDVSFLAARPEDAEAIAALALAVFRSDYYSTVLRGDEVDYFWNRMYRPEILRAEMARGVSYEKILRQDRMIGFLSCVMDRASQRLRLGKLYLLPEHQGLGIGKLALRRVQAEARRLGASEVFLYVFRKNWKAIRVYQGAGFVFQRAERSYTEDGYCYEDYLLCWRPAPSAPFTPDPPFPDIRGHDTPIPTRARSGNEVRRPPQARHE